MITCRYVGNDISNIGNTEFEVVGQMATFSEQQFYEVVLGGAAFIPEFQFEKSGITDQELSLYGSIGCRVDAPDSFMSKLISAQNMFVGIRDELMTLDRDKRTAIIASLTNENLIEESHT